MVLLVLTIWQRVEVGTLLISAKVVFLAIRSVVMVGCCSTFCVFRSSS
jgi:hypothetical protein